MIKIWYGLFLILGTSALSSIACDDDNSEKEPPALLDPFDDWDMPVFDALSSQTSPAGRDDLIGRWAQEGDDPETIEFKKDGTFTSSFENTPGKWSVSGRMLSVHFRWDEEAYEEVKDTSTFAIVDNTFYDTVLIRTEGSGTELDGTWQYAMQGADTVFAPDEDERAAYGIEAKFTINGDAFEYTYEMFDQYYENGKKEDDSHDTSTGSGTLVVEENRIYLNITEYDGFEFDCLQPDCGVQMNAEEAPGIFLGHRISDDIIVASDFDDSLAAEAYLRQ
jgi:hypothetical protein